MNNSSKSALPKPKTGKKKRVLFITLGILATLIVVWQFLRKPILFSMYGIHTPRVESAESILYTAKKYKLDTASIVSVSPNEHSSLFSLFGNSIPEALVFDKSGRYIAYKSADNACNAGLFGFIPALDKNTHYKTTSETTLPAHIAKLRDLTGNPLPATYINTNADYYVLISWVAWAGKLNEDHVGKWEALAANNHKANIQVIAVNFDPQQWWPVAAQDSILKKHGGI